MTRSADSDRFGEPSNVSCWENVLDNYVAILKYFRTNTIGQIHSTAYASGPTG